VSTRYHLFHKILGKRGKRIRPDRGTRRKRRGGDRKTRTTKKPPKPTRSKKTPTKQNPQNPTPETQQSYYHDSTGQRAKRRRMHFGRGAQKWRNGETPFSRQKEDPPGGHQGQKKELASAKAKDRKKNKARRIGPVK